VREGLLAENVFVFAHGRGGDGGVEMVGGANDDGIEIFFFVEEFAVIGIGRTAARISGASAGGVVGIHNFLRGSRPATPPVTFRVCESWMGSSG